MTEQEWSVAVESNTMLRFLCEQSNIVRRKAGRRKLRLFGCACCWKMSDQMTDARSRAAVEVAERLADGRASASEGDDARGRAHQAVISVIWTSEELARERLGRDQRRAAQAAYMVLENQYGNFAWAGLAWACDEGDPAGHRAYLDEQREQAATLRCIFGPLLFRRIAVDPAWTTVTVKQLAQSIYNDRGFERMPILADALEEAGCTNVDILAHCREPGPHARGCWVVDLLLGKE
jgi:hypothetical protein